MGECNLSSDSENNITDAHCGSNPKQEKVPLWLDGEIEKIDWPSKHVEQNAFLQGVRLFFGNANDDDANNDRKDDLQVSIHQYAASLQPLLVSIRRLLHRYPELMFQEKITSQIVRRILAEMGIKNYSTGWAINIYSEYHNNPGAGGQEVKNFDGGGFGIVADIGTGEAPCVLLRADMDALPLVERTPLPPNLSDHDHFRSHHHGKMHACGHDAHMTMLLGAIYLFQSLATKDSNGETVYPFPGTIRVIFQPAEEGGAGAKRMIQEGVLTAHPAPSYAFAMHVWPTLPSGQIGFRSGPMLGSADMFTLTIEGVGGHAAFPHLVKDPIVASAAIVMNLQTLVSRGLNPLESGVISVSYLESGDGAHNVIPSKAIIRGTIRALSDEAMRQLKDGLVHIASKTADAHGCKLSSSEFSRDHYPVTMNDSDLFQFASRVGGIVADGRKVTDVDPTMGAEDFAFIAQSVPSAFFFLGQGGRDHSNHESRVPTNLGLHHPEFNLDEEVMSKGVELFVNLALRSLKDLNERRLNN
mmetsp:Transcript_8130/g.15094  ORF Transcript_8130/g.15094 Transcript_8130/m.15094 type:complete len:527 (-) Transcript_8130:47-1627(-)